MTDFLQNSSFTPKELWELIKSRINDSEEAFLLVDDSVQNKQYSHLIETVKLQYSGNEHGLVKGIGLVNLVHTNGSLGDFIPSIIRFTILIRTVKPRMTIFKRYSSKRLKVNKSKRGISPLTVGMRRLTI